MPSTHGHHGSAAHAHEKHRSQRAPMLRAAVLGANDGIVSTAGLMIGVAATEASSSAVVTAGFAGLVAGALSMAAGEYVSVGSQRDSEVADLEMERRELERSPEAELEELTQIYEQRGLDRELAGQVARQLHDHDALDAHLRDELNLRQEELADPTAAAVISALAFSLGAGVPVLTGWLVGDTATVLALAGTALVALAVLGTLGARIGGARRSRGAVRVLAWGAAAMVITWAIGSLVGVVA